MSVLGGFVVKCLVEDVWGFEFMLKIYNLLNTKAKEIFLLKLFD